MRGKKTEVLEIPPAPEQTQDNGNGEPIPVKYESAEMYFDTTDKKFYMTIRVGLKKIFMEEVSRK